jgi:hypothetical protein
MIFFKKILQTKQARHQGNPRTLAVPRFVETKQKWTAADLISAVLTSY